MAASSTDASHIETPAAARANLGRTSSSILAFWLIAFCGLASCGPLGSGSELVELRLPSGDILLFPRRVEPELRPGEVGGTALALLPGTLTIAGECLVAVDHHDGSNYTPIWPPAYQADIVGPDRVEVRDSEGLLVGGFGDDIVLFGAVTDSLDGFERTIPSAVRQEVERRCPPSYWIVGGVSERVEP